MTSADARMDDEALALANSHVTPEGRPLDVILMAVVLAGMVVGVPLGAMAVAELLAMVGVVA